MKASILLRVALFTAATLLPAVYVTAQVCVDEDSITVCTCRDDAESRLQAEACVGQLLERGGPDTVLTEIALIRSDYSLRLYLAALAELADLDDIQFIRAVEQADRINSDHQRDPTLRALADDAHDVKRADALLSAAAKIDNDHVLRMLLVKLAEELPLSNREGDLVEALGSIDGNYELRVAVAGVAKALRANEADLLDVLALVGELIDSDYEKSAALTAVAEAVRGNALLLARYAEISAGLGDYYENQALEAIGR